MPVVPTIASGAEIIIVASAAVAPAGRLLYHHTVLPHEWASVCLRSPMCEISGDIFYQQSDQNVTV